MSFDEDKIKNKLEELNKTVKEFEDMTDEEHKENTTSWEDFMKELEDDESNEE